MGFIEWLQQKFVTAESKCVVLEVNEEDDESVMAPPFRHGVLLPSGATLPAIGLGVYQSSPGQETYHAVLSALRGGYRHIDTAQVYRNEADVGRAVRDAGVPRSEVFVTTKLWLSNWGAEACRRGVRESLSRLGMDHVDLFLLHAPGPGATRAETWAALEACQKEGLIRDIGVSNFGQPHLEKLAQSAAVQPAVNQIELSPFLQRRELVSYCQEKGIIVEAYSPLARARKLADPTVTAVAARVGATPAQVLVQWSLKRGFVPLPKSVQPARQRENLEGAAVVLSEADMQLLDSLEEGFVTGWDPIADAPV